MAGEKPIVNLEGYEYPYWHQLCYKCRTRDQMSESEFQNITSQPENEDAKKNHQ